jgi:pyridinium-3,5-biscarboxylic acid mononucleotide sulfurtransferase
VPTDPPRPPLDTPQALRDRVMACLATLSPGGAVVALSGGADSALLLHLCARAWGPGRVLAVTSRSESLPASELEAARAQAARAGVEHLVLRGSELEIEAFRRNAPDRCFHCKDHLYGQLRRVAVERGLPEVLDGTNADDLGGHRPGFAAGRRHGVRSPLLDAGLAKADVRRLSQAEGLSTWDKPAEACLSSRFPYGTHVTAEALRRVEAAERCLRDLGFRVVRVRVHDPVARIEVPVEDLPALLAPGTRERVVAGVKAAGFAYVALDVEGFRSGSLNETLRPGRDVPRRIR